MTVERVSDFARISSAFRAAVISLTQLGIRASFHLLRPLP